MGWIPPQIEMFGGPFDGGFVTVPDHLKSRVSRVWDLGPNKDAETHWYKRVFEGSKSRYVWEGQPK